MHLPVVSRLTQENSNPVGSQSAPANPGFLPADPARQRRAQAFTHSASCSFQELQSLQQIGNRDFKRFGNQVDVSERQIVSAL